MKIGIDIDGVILDYQRVLNTYGDLYDFIELGKDGIVNRNEHYLRNRYNWTNEERMNFVNKYFLKLSMQTHLIPGAKDVINMLQKDGNLSFDKYYWKEDNKVEVAKKENIDVMIDDTFEVCQKLSSNGIKTIYFRDKDMKKLEQNENLKEVSNWGEIYRYIKGIENK